MFVPVSQRWDGGDGFRWNVRFILMQLYAHKRQSIRSREGYHVVQTFRIEQRQIQSLMHTVCTHVTLSSCKHKTRHKDNLNDGNGYVSGDWVNNTSVMSSSQATAHSHVAVWFACEALAGLRPSRSFPLPLVVQRHKAESEINLHNWIVILPSLTNFNHDQIAHVGTLPPRATAAFLMSARAT